MLILWAFQPAIVDKQSKVNQQHCSAAAKAKQLLVQISVANAAGVNMSYLLTLQMRLAMMR